MVRPEDCGPLNDVDEARERALEKSVDKYLLQHFSLDRKGTGSIEIDLCEVDPNSQTPMSTLKVREHLVQRYRDEAGWQIAGPIEGTKSSYRFNGVYIEREVKTENKP